MAEPIQSPAVSGPFEARQPLAVTPPGDPGDLFSSQTFLKVLGAQMRTQNPMQPLKDTEFIAQMTQFSSLEQITRLNSTMTAMGLSMQLTQGAAMIGRTVTYLPDGAATPVTGTVDRLLVANGGREMNLVVGGVQVPTSQVVEVSGS